MANPSSCRRPLLALAIMLMATSACRDIESSSSRMDPSDRDAIAREIEERVRAAYDLAAPGVEERLLALYPDSGRVVSAAGGTMITDRDSIAEGIRYFWRNVGVNMRNPVWTWDRVVIDVLDRDAAVMTATYRVDHRTPANVPHRLGGAWTAVFRREGGRWVIVQEHLSDAPEVFGDSSSANHPQAHPPSPPSH